MCQPLVVLEGCLGVMCFPATHELAVACMDVLMSAQGVTTLKPFWAESTLELPISAVHQLVTVVQ